MAAKFNKGDVAEGILGAAMTARFLSKTKKITPDDVVKVVKQLKKPVQVKKALVSTTKFKSPNKNPKIVDDLTCVIGLAATNMNAFLDTSLYTTDKEIKEIVNAACAYSNGVYVMEWADMFYNNNQYNDIYVRSEGLLDQSGTKVDLKIVADGKQCGVGISLKQGDVKQFGQVGGASFDSMNEFFGPLGVKFTSADQKKLEAAIAKKDVPGGLRHMYKEAQKQIAVIMKSNPDKFKKNLSDFMNFHASRDEPDVALVQLNRSEAAYYDFTNIRKRLAGVKLGIEYVEGSTEVIAGEKIPKLKIVSEAERGDNGLLDLRVKLEGNRIDSKGKKVGLTVRNYVEKGHLTTKLLAEKFM